MIAAALDHRDVRFILAAKVFSFSFNKIIKIKKIQSYRKPIIGHLAKATGGIPVERAQALSLKITQNLKRINI